MDNNNSNSSIDSHPLIFSGRGTEYFRVWFVNVLLCIVTLGFYTPVARQRTARYFFSNTIVADSPLEFTGQLRKMMFGFLIFVGLYVAYEIAGKTGQSTAQFLLVLAAIIMAPWIWGSAMRFRLRSTRWRGLQLQFQASWLKVYLASWPIFAMVGAWVLVTFAINAISPDLPDPPVPPGSFWLINTLMEMTLEMWGLIAMGIVMSVLSIIRLEFNYKSLLFRHAGIGNQRGRWKPFYGDFVKVWGAATLVFLLSITVATALIALIVYLMVGSYIHVPQMKGDSEQSLQVILFFIFLGLGFAFMLFFASAPARAYREARMFQLVWSNVGFGHVARFRCTLKTSSYVWLRLRNMLFTLLSLGIYRPFAKVSEYRMRVESVTLFVKGGLDQLYGELVKQQGGLGDALADAAGLDLIG
jgi:uncharacterized membrane protein YjgN (DUF898 family)